MKKIILFLFWFGVISAEAADYTILDFGAKSDTTVDYTILDFGAKSDTTVLSTAALQQAIDACSEAGGGRVVVPAGHYKIGTIVLKSNVHLYLEQGATLYGSTDLKDYCPMKSDYVSLRTKTNTIQLIYADKVKNVSIDGYGTIDGRGRAFKKHSWNDERMSPSTVMVLLMAEEGLSRNIPGMMKALRVRICCVSFRAKTLPSRALR